MSEEVISKDYEISETFDKFFANIVPKLKITAVKTFKVLLSMKQKTHYKTQ